MKPISLEGCTEEIRDIPAYNSQPAERAQVSGTRFGSARSILPHSIYLFEQDKTVNHLPLYPKLPTKKSHQYMATPTSRYLDDYKIVLQGLLQCTLCYCFIIELNP